MCKHLTRGLQKSRKEILIIISWRAGPQTWTLRLIPGWGSGMCLCSGQHLEPTVWVAVVSP